MPNQIKYKRINRKRGTLLERFLFMIDKNLDGHWYWRGSINGFNNGYGRMRDEEGNLKSSHLISFLLFKKDIYDPTLLILHTCDIPTCCNPDHLKQGTQKENVQDCISKGRHINCRVNKF